MIKDEGGWNTEKALEEEEEELRERGVESYRDALQRYETLVKTVATDEQTTLQNISAAGNNLIETSGDIIRLKKQNVLGDEVLDRRITFERDEDVYLKYVNEALQRESEEEAKGQEEVQATIHWATSGTIVVTILTVLLALFAGFYISHLISARVIRLENAIQRVGEGELETRIEIGAKDEIGELARIQPPEDRRGLTKFRQRNRIKSIICRQMIELQVGVTLMRELIQNRMRMQQLNCLAPEGARHSRRRAGAGLQQDRPATIAHELVNLRREYACQQNFVVGLSKIRHRRRHVV